eukprot:1838924-Ditylum_brightwellii.AAC.2
MQNTTSKLREGLQKSIINLRTTALPLVKVKAKGLPPQTGSFKSLPFSWLFTVCALVWDNTGNTYVDEEKQKDETPTTIRDNIQHIAQIWEQLLYGSGGKLCQKKPFWWLIWWIWKDWKATLATKSKVNINVHIMFGREDNATTVKQRNCTVAAKDLGVLVNPVGDYSPEFEQRKDISIQVTQHTKKVSLSAKNAYQLYQNN